MKFKIDDILRCLEDAKERLLVVNDTFHYVSTLVEIRAWMDELAHALTVGDLSNPKYERVYREIFCPEGGISDYDKVCNSIEEYALDDLPF